MHSAYCMGRRVVQVLFSGQGKRKGQRAGMKEGSKGEK